MTINDLRIGESGTIDKVGGEGTAVFACEAIKAAVAKK